jgi:hypothetical protein
MLSFSEQFFNLTADLMSGLQINDLDNFSHLLTGYVGSASFLEQVYNNVKQLKEKNPKLIYGKKFTLIVLKHVNKCKTLF